MAPRIILSDNGGKFNNIELREFGEAFNVKSMTTAAESPLSNDICERQNAVIGDLVGKIIADSSCDVYVALAWAVSARNALTNSSGFSLNQLVFGYNPVLQSVFGDDLPGLELRSDSEIDHLNALNASQKTFIEYESNERLTRALRHNVRSTDLEDLQNEEEVFYKRMDNREWRGPGTVTGRNGKQVLLKHRGVYVRAHVCPLTCKCREDLNARCDALRIDNTGCTAIHN